MTVTVKETATACSGASRTVIVMVAEPGRTLVSWIERPPLFGSAVSTTDACVITA